MDRIKGRVYENYYGFTIMTDSEGGLTCLTPSIFNHSDWAEHTEEGIKKIKEGIDKFLERVEEYIKNRR